tara:strand:+ start:321 stop:857 length:537 start_codon:yes stop_codon:yes gene_type:complete
MKNIKMKRLLLAPLLLGLVSPTALIAEEGYYKCLALGKRECAIKQKVIGTCATMIYTNEGMTKRQVIGASLSFYKEYIKETGFKPTKEQREPKRKMTAAEEEELESLIKAKIMSTCSQDFYQYAANSYVKLKEEGRKENKPYEKTYTEHVEDLPVFEYFMFSGLVRIAEAFEEREKQK